MRRAFPHAGRVLFLCLAFAAPVNADPIQVTAGHAFMWWDGTGSNAALLGNGLSVLVDTYGGGLIAFPAGQATLDGSVVFGTLGAVQHAWQVTVGGTDYLAYLDGFLHFDTEPFDAPFPTSSTPAEVVFTTPFTMTGRLRGATARLDEGGLVLFDVLLSGHGIASTSARPAGDAAYLVNGGVRYDFTDGVAATPEPATLLLMSTGLAGALLRKRRWRGCGRADEGMRVS
jgi:hypothetical protein